MRGKRVDPILAGIIIAVLMGNINYHIDKLTRNAFRKKGFATAKIITEWADILRNPALSDNTTPIKIVYPAGKSTDGVLHIKTSGSLALELQQYEPKIVEKIATYFGFKAIKSIRIIHEH